MVIKSNFNEFINPCIHHSLDILNIGILHINNYKIINISKGTTSLLGYTKSSLLNKSIINIFNHDKKELDEIFKKNNIKNKSFNILGKHKNGNNILISMIITKSIKDKSFFIIIQDASSNHDDINNLIQLAYNDQLTNIPNLTLFMDRAMITKSQSKRQNYKFAILYIDIDGFKKINDKIGHFAGDIILKTLSKNLKKSIRDSDTVARIGGDEFLILLQNITSKNIISIIVKRIFNLNKKSITIKGNNVKINISLGISIYPKDSKNINTLINKADKAMYESKKSNPNNFKYYEKNM